MTIASFFTISTVPVKGKFNTTLVCGKTFIFKKILTILKSRKILGLQPSIEFTPNIIKLKT